MIDVVRHPPQSGWLDEWDRLKGGHLLSLGVALKRACINGSELSVCSIRGFLLADVLADLLQFKADRRDSVTAGPQMFTREIPFPHSRAIAIALFPAYSEACRSAFRNDVDQHSEVVPISIPN